MECGRVRRMGNCEICGVDIDDYLDVMFYQDVGGAGASYSLCEKCQSELINRINRVAYIINNGRYLKIKIPEMAKY
jgi:hypothetical protein